MTGFMNIHQEPPLAPDEPYPWFGRVHVETTSYCNRTCVFCPISTGRRDFYESMSGEMYGRLMLDLERIKFSGFIALFLLNEPLLDKLIHARAFEARTACPKSTIYISTNGDTLIRNSRGLDRIKALYTSGVNSININVYDTGKKGEGRLAATETFAKEVCGNGLAMRHGNKYAKVSASRNWLAVTDMRPDRPAARQSYDEITARTSEDRQEVVAPQTHCPRPARDLVVRYDGAVLMCCALDPSKPEEGTIAGWLGKESLHNIWNGDVMRRYRYMLQNKRRVLPGCNTCTQKVAYPFAFRRISATPEEFDRWEAMVR